MLEIENEKVYHHFLTNIHNNDKELVIKAAKLSGFTEILRIYAVATCIDIDQPILENHFGLYTIAGTKNHSKFWDKLRELKKVKYV